MQDCDLHVQTDQNMQASDLGNKPRKILRKPNMNLTESIHELSKRARIILTSELNQKVKEVHGLFLVGQNWKKLSKKKKQQLNGVSVKNRCLMPRIIIFTVNCHFYFGRISS